MQQRVDGANAGRFQGNFCSEAGDYCVSSVGLSHSPLALILFYFFFHFGEARGMESLDVRG